MDNPSFLWQLIQTGGALGVLSLVTWLLIIGKLRLEREYLDMRDQRDRALNEARANSYVMKEAANVAERAIESSGVH